MNLPTLQAEMSSLNPSQRTAVEHTEGPLLVLAGAGSGKTRVITHRIVHLLRRGTKPEQIVAVSFTNKAAGEMRDRLAAMIGEEVAHRLVLATFHSLGARMMRDHPRDFGLDGGRFSILDQGDVFGLVRGLLREYGHHGEGIDRRYDLAAIVQRLSLWKNEFRSPADVAADVLADEYDAVAASIYQPYGERLKALGAVDFDDLVCRIAAALRDDDKIRGRWHQRFEYFMVDEYQDTNRAQFEMVKQLAAARQNLCVVGDDDQAIYGWRGADIANILGFERHFPGAMVVKLEHNYRSRPSILRCANATIAHNRLRHAKELRPYKRGGEPVSHVVAADPNGEARWVGKQIRTLVIERGVPAPEIAVLYRSAVQTRAIEQELREHGIEYRVLGGQAFYDKKEVKDALAYLRVLVMPRDELAVRRALETPPRGIGDKSLTLLRGFAETHRIGLLDAIHRAREMPELPSRAADALHRFSQQIRAASTLSRREGDMAAGLAWLLDEVELRHHVVREAGSEAAAQARWAGVDWLLGNMKRWESRVKQRGQRPKWHEYLGSLALDGQASSATDIEPSHAGKVTLATLHSAKGLEWDYVFLIGCEEGQLPHRRVASPRANEAIAGDIEEERRLFYVGITRARERLWLTRAAARVERGHEQPRAPSRFLQELSTDDLKLYEIEREEELSSTEIGAIADEFLAKLAGLRSQ